MYDRSISQLKELVVPRVSETRSVAPLPSLPVFALGDSVVWCRLSGPIAAEADTWADVRGSMVRVSTNWLLAMVAELCVTTGGVTATHRSLDENVGKVHVHEAVHLVGHAGVRRCFPPWMACDVTSPPCCVLVPQDGYGVQQHGSFRGAVGRYHARAHWPGPGMTARVCCIVVDTWWAGTLMDVWMAGTCASLPGLDVLDLSV